MNHLTFFLLRFVQPKHGDADLSFCCGEAFAAAFEFDKHLLMLTSAGDLAIDLSCHHPPYTHDFLSPRAQISVAASIQVKRVRCVAMSWGIPSLNSE
jgi:hypothetical protein